MSSLPENTTLPARVVLLCGPSGSGKSTLAERAGLPVLQLDDFYKDGDDPTLPRVPRAPQTAGGGSGSGDGDGGVTDWDHPASWHADDAMAAIRRLCSEGRAEIPVYSIPDNGRVGMHTLELDGATAFIAEGIFAAEIVRRCEAEGLLGDAICLRNRPTATAWRRFRRDVRERRKSVPYLLHRGWRLMRAERGIVARQIAQGAYPCHGDAALTRIRAAADQPAALPVS
ncbi:uridine kinase [Streptacidiphilus sp. MAP12-16]|uniref:ATP-binding protein n=1 Tax=Streptacidiphilus sp. MAP12-16 TaxID=3156300 RepID=UPI0035186B32